MHASFKMKLSLTAFAFFIFYIQLANSQCIFQKTYGGPVLDWCNNIKQMPDSGYLMICSNKDTISGQEDINLIRTTQDGDTIWTRSYGGSTNNDAGNNAFVSADGGFIISGTTECFGAGGKDICLIKTDLTGSISWAKTYGGPNVDYCSGMQPCIDGGYIICGATSSFGVLMEDAYLIRTDSIGDTLWTRTYGSAATDIANAVVQTPDSGFIVVGNSNVSGSIDIFLIKTNAQGDVLWSKSYGGPSNDDANAIIVLPDGYCIAGSTNSFGAGAMDGYLIRTDLLGDTLWSKTFGTNDSDAFNAIHITSDSGFIMTGFANKINNVNDDILICKTNSLGQLEWKQIIGGSTVARDVGQTITQTFDGGYLVSGYSQSFGGGTDIILIKADVNGYAGCNHHNYPIITNSPATVHNNLILQESSGTIIGSPAFQVGHASIAEHTLCITTGINHLENDAQIETTVMPNPFSVSTVINIKSPDKNNKIILILTDLSGAEVRRVLINTMSQTDQQHSTFNFEKGSLLAGMYIYSVYAVTPEKNVADAFLGSGKLIVE